MTSYWIPYAAQPRAADGTSGVFVVASDQATATPVSIAPGPVAVGYLNSPVAAYVQQYQLDGNGQVSRTVLSEGFYATGSATTQTHLFRVDLADTSTPPVPVEVGAATVLFQPCVITAVEQQLNQPSTSLILLETAGVDGQCNAVSDNPIYLYKVGDGSDVAPMLTPIQANLDGSTVAVTSGTTGNLAGLVYRDHSGNLLFSTPSFASPKVLLGGTTSFTKLHSDKGYVFVAVVAAGKLSTYRIDDSGAISGDLYDFQANGFVGQVLADDANGYLWVEDVGGTFDNDFLETAYSDRLVRLALSGASAGQAVYTTSGSLAAGFQGQVDVLPVAVNGTSLLFEVESLGFYVNSPALPATIYSLPVGAAPGTKPTTVASLPFGWYGFNRLAGGQLFVTAHTISDSQSHGVSNSAQVLSGDGTVIKNIPASIFEGDMFTVSGTPLAPTHVLSTVYVAEGYSAPISSSDVGGATAYAMSAADLTQSPVTLPDGSNYIFSHNEQPEWISDGPSALAVIDYMGSASKPGVGVLDAGHNRWIPIATPVDTQQLPFPEGASAQ